MCKIGTRAGLCTLLLGWSQTEPRSCWGCIRSLLSSGTERATSPLLCDTQIRTVNHQYKPHRPKQMISYSQIKKHFYLMDEQYLKRLRTSMKKLKINNALPFSTNLSFQQGAFIRQEYVLHILRDYFQLQMNIF